MTQENKNLLLKDLCARLPYGVRARFCDGVKEEIEDVWDIDMFSGAINADYIIDDVKLCLRPMSSMTDDERDEFRNVGGVMSHDVQNDTWALCAFAPEAYDWINAHHFDYRGLIEKGLALKAPKGMYKETKED